MKFLQCHLGFHWMNYHCWFGLSQFETKEAYLIYICSWWSPCSAFYWLYYTLVIYVCSDVQTVQTFSNFKGTSLFMIPSVRNLTSRTVRLISPQIFSSLDFDEVIWLFRWRNCEQYNSKRPNIDHNNTVTYQITALRKW